MYSQIGARHFRTVYYSWTYGCRLGARCCRAKRELFHRSICSLVLLHSVFAIFACFNPACVFVLFDRDNEPDFSMSCYDTLVTKRSISTVCLVNWAWLPSHCLHVSNRASDNTLTAPRIDFRRASRKWLFKSGKEKCRDTPVLMCSRVSKVSYSEDSSGTSSPWKSDWESEKWPSIDHFF